MRGTTLNKININIQMIIFVMFAILLGGCNDDGQLLNKGTSKGHFVEAGLDYTTNGISVRTVSYNKDYALKSDENGTFKYYKDEIISFYSGDYLIGSIDKVNEDGLVFIQDILGVDRVTGLVNQGVANLSRILLAIGDNDISDTNQTTILNNFNVKDANETAVTDMLTSIGLADVNQTYALNHTEYYYKLIKKAPELVGNISRITSSFCIDINTTTVPSLLSNEDKIKTVDVYMNGIYQETIVKDINESRYTLNITLDATSNINRAKEFDITFKTNKDRNDTLHYESPKYTIVVPSPMLGQWIDSQTREIVYLKDESELSHYEIKDINQLKDTASSGRYLIRAGIGEVNLFGTIRKLSTDSNNSFRTVDMKIKHVDSNFSVQYRLELADVNNTASSIKTNDEGIEVLYVNGTTSEYMIPKNLDVDIKDIRAISGKTEIYIRETDENNASYSKVSLFNIDNITNDSYDFGILNITDSTIDYNVVSKFKEDNDYLYFGYEIENLNDKPITYSKTIEICNNGNNHISSAVLSVENGSHNVFKTFSATAVSGDGFESEVCKEIPITFSFNKPSEITDVNLTIKVTSGAKVWEDHQRLRVSDETFVKLNFLSKNTPLNNFIYIGDGDVLSEQFEQNTTNYINVPRYASTSYQIAVSPQTVNVENAFVVGVDMISDIKDWKDYVGTYGESTNDTYLIDQLSCPFDASQIGAETLASRYGETVGYITYEDIDYFTLNELPAVTNKYTSFETNSSLTSKQNIVIPFYTQLRDVNSTNIKVYDGNTEIVTVTPTFSDANQSITIVNSADFVAGTTYTIKLITGLSSDLNQTLLRDQQWDVEFKKTNLVATGQTTSYVTNDDGTYKNGVSMVQIRNNDNNTTTDINTKLIWQDNNDTQSIVKNYTDAKAYCTDLNTSAYTSWRLPNRNELLTLVDYTQSSPAMHNSFGYVVSNGKYWTVTLEHGNTDAAWYVDFENGTTSTATNANNEYNVRCVVDSSDTNGTNFYLKTEFDEVADNKVEDRNSTYLVWQNDLDVGTDLMTFEAAVNACEILNLEGITNWRLPNIKELTTIIDDNVHAPAIKTASFENTTNNYYWSSTTTASDTTKAWSINFNYGTHNIVTKTNSAYVRCVSRGSN